MIDIKNLSEANEMSIKDVTISLSHALNVPFKKHPNSETYKAVVSKSKLKRVKDILNDLGLIYRGDGKDFLDKSRIIYDVYASIAFSDYYDAPVAVLLKRDTLSKDLRIFVSKGHRIMDKIGSNLYNDEFFESIEINESTKELTFRQVVNNIKQIGITLNKVTYPKNTDCKFVGMLGKSGSALYNKLIEFLEANSEKLKSDKTDTHINDYYLFRSARIQVSESLVTKDVNVWVFQNNW